MAHEKGVAGYEKNMGTAMKYYEKSANLGYCIAQDALGDEYYEGNSACSKDFSKAFCYYKLGLFFLMYLLTYNFHIQKKKAAKSGYYYSQYNLSVFFLFLTFLGSIG